MTIYTALITPFNQKHQLDEEGLSLLIERQKQARVDGLVVLGTTAETPTLTLHEKDLILQQVKNSGLPYIVGCGSNCTRTTLANIEWAAKWGAREVLVVSPYYNRPSPRGLIAHFLTLADQSPCPIILYNHPGRTSVLISPEMLLELAAHPNIVGVKEVTTHFIDTLITLKRVYPSFRVYAGDDQMAFTARINGGDGVISVASNLIVESMCRLMRDPSKEAGQLQYLLWPFFQALVCDTNPIPIKAALELEGLPAGPVRMPLLPLEDSLKKSVERSLKWK